jgi:hypothetical protein
MVIGAAVNYQFVLHAGTQDVARASTWDTVYDRAAPQADLGSFVGLNLRPKGPPAYLVEAVPATAASAPSRGAAISARNSILSIPLIC